MFLKHKASGKLVEVLGCATCSTPSMRHWSAVTTPAKNSRTLSNSVRPSSCSAPANPCPSVGPTSTIATTRPFITTG